MDINGVTSAGGRALRERARRRHLTVTGDPTSEKVEEAARIVRQSQVFDQAIPRCSHSATDVPVVEIYFWKPPPGRVVRQALCAEGKVVFHLALALEKVLNVNSMIGPIDGTGRCQR